MPDRPGAPGRFRLMRFFTLTTAVLFAAAGVALYVLQRGEEAYFAQAQDAQRALFAKAQGELAQRNAQTARGSLLAVYEASHVNLTRLVANTLWASDFAPLVAAAQQVPVQACAAMAAASAPRRACFGQAGQRIHALPGFAALDRRAHESMRGTSVFKIKVFDLRGVTVYSSEHAQIGEDASGNAGWQAAAAGRPASELTHRERFSAFEGVVENRDLISTYVPVRAGPGDAVVGVFELYSDVTPFLAQIQEAAQGFEANIAANELRVGDAARAQQREVNESSNEFLFIVGGLMALLYVASLVIVRIGQRIIDRQWDAQSQAVAREQLWHREKMAALSAMAANVSHEVGNPLAVISGVAQSLPEEPGSELPVRRTILEQAARISAMTRKIAEFAAAPSEEAQVVDINPIVEAVCEFQRFDRRFRATRIDFVPGQGLPARLLVPDHLNEVMMNLLQACAGVVTPEDQRRGIRVATVAQADGEVRIVMSMFCPQSGADLPVGDVTLDPRFEPARRRIGDMGARLEFGATQLRIVLPARDTVPA